MQWIYCINKECRYYDKRYADKIEDERLSTYDICLNDKVEKLILLRGQVDDSKGPPKRR